MRRTSSGSTLRLRENALLGRVTWSAAGLSAPLLSLIVLTPSLVRTLGTDRYGAWALVTTLVATGTGLDGGVGAALLRWFGAYRVRGARVEATRLSLTALGVIFGIFVLVTSIVVVSAPWLSEHLRAPKSVKADVQGLLHWVGVLITVPLAANVFGAQLEAHSRFKAIGLTSIVAHLGFCVAALLLVPRFGLFGLVKLAAVRDSSILLVYFTLAREHLSLSLKSPGSLDRSELARFFAFAGRLQLGALALLVMLEGNAFIVAATLPIKYVAFYALASSIATGLRNIPLFAVPPVYARIVATLEESGTAAALHDAARIQRLWLAGLAGFSLVACASGFAAVRAWVGSDFSTAGWLTMIMIAGNSVAAGTSVTTCLARAFHLPGLEATYLWLSVLCSVTLVIPLFMLFGIYGIVAATVMGQIAGALWLPRRLASALQANFPPFWEGVPWRQALGFALVAGTASTAIAISLSHGPATLILTAVPSACAVAGFAFFVLRPAAAAIWNQQQPETDEQVTS